MKTTTLCQSVIRYAAVILLTTSCTVYAPMHPTISAISGRGQTEIAGSVQPNGRLEASVVHSPLPNLLVMAAGTFRPNLSLDSTFNTTRQWEAGVGGYLPLGHRWQLTALAGYGRANTHRAYVEPFIFWGGLSLDEYQARYSKTFGQLSLTHEFGRGSFGAVYRLSRIRFEELNYTSHKQSFPVDLRTMTRHEPLLFARVALDAESRWQVQGTTGMSFSLDREQDTANNSALYQANHTLMPVLMASLGIVFRPHTRRQQ